MSYIASVNFNESCYKDHDVKNLKIKHFQLSDWKVLIQGIVSMDQEQVIHDQTLVERLTCVLRDENIGKDDMKSTLEGILYDLFYCCVDKV